MQRQIATRGQSAPSAFGEAALEGAHRNVVRYQDTVEADMPADNAVDDGG